MKTAWIGFAGFVAAFNCVAAIALGAACVSDCNASNPYCRCSPASLKGVVWDGPWCIDDSNATLIEDDIPLGDGECDSMTTRDVIKYEGCTCTLACDPTVPAGATRDGVFSGAGSFADDCDIDGTEALFNRLCKLGAI